MTVQCLFNPKHKSSVTNTGELRIERIKIGPEVDPLMVQLQQIIGVNLKWDQMQEFYVSPDQPACHQHQQAQCD